MWFAVTYGGLSGGYSKKIVGGCISVEARMAVTITGGRRFGWRVGPQAKMGTCKTS